MIIIKTIGVIIRDLEENNKKFIGIRADLFKIFYKYNINLIGIPISNDFKKTREIIELCDGIILSGGDNFIENDFLIVDYLHKNDIPTLGICLGMQAMAKYFSNQEEIEVKNHLSNDLYVHHINIKRNSLLYKIIEKERILVNSRHKSAIAHTNLNVSAVSDDGVIEAVEDSSRKFFLGLEWHPESIGDENSYKIIESFLNIIK